MLHAKFKEGKKERKYILKTDLDQNFETVI